MPAVALLAGLFAALSTVALSIYVRMWSETLFLVLFLFGMLMVSRYLTRTEPGVWDAVAARGCGLLCWRGWPAT